MMRWLGRIVVALLLLVGVGLLVTLLGSIPPQMEHARRGLAREIDFERLFSQLTADNFDQWHRRIVAPSSRLAGLDGEQEVSRAVEAQLRRLGLETVVQRFAVTVPVTKWCTLEKSDGGPITNVSIAPFWPNVVRTCTTPPHGIVGQVVEGRTGRFDDLAGKSIDGKILLLDMNEGFGWLPAAKLGAAAILFRASDDPASYVGKILNFPANLPRFLVDGDTDELVGAHLRIRAKVDWEVRDARNVFGVLRAAAASSDALVLLGHMDAWSVVPALAPGYYEGCSITALLEIARVLSAQRQGLGRTVIFGALSARCLASEGARVLSDALGPGGREAPNLAFLRREAATSQRQAEALQGAVAAISDVNYWQLDASLEPPLWAKHGQAARRALASVVERLVDGYVSRCEDEAGIARVAWVDRGRPRVGPVMDRYLASAARLRRSRSAAGADLIRLKQYFSDVLGASGLRKPSLEIAAEHRAERNGELQRALDEALGHAQRDLGRKRDSVAVGKLFLEYPKSDYVLLYPSAVGQRIAFTGFPKLCGDVVAARDAVVQRWLMWRGQSVEDPTLFSRHVMHDDKNLIPAAHKAGPYCHTPHGNHSHATEFWTRPFRQSSQKIFAFWGTEASRGYQTPRDQHVVLEDVTVQTQLMAAMAAQMASAGYVASKTHQPAEGLGWFYDYGGQVMAKGGRNALLPDRPLRDALVVLRDIRAEVSYIHKSRDGSFRFPAVARRNTLGCDAYRLDERTGDIKYARDLGPDGQRHQNVFQERTLAKQMRTRIVLPVDRFEPTDIYHLVGAAGQSLTTELLDAVFRSPPNRYSIREAWEQGTTVFLPPGHRFYVVLKDMPTDTLHRVTRHLGRTGSYKMGFLLGNEPDVSPQAAYPAASDDFWQPGYLAGKDRRIVFQELDAATSVGGANRHRLATQGRKGLADPVTSQLSRAAVEKLDEGKTAFRERSYAASYRSLAASLATSMRAYPFVRNAIGDALLGILVYMFFMLPFAYFAERLLLASNDIRPRIIGAFGIFLAMFLIIRLTHPAYEIVRNPMVVLVAFTIFMLSLMLLGFLSGKVALRMRQLRAAGGGQTEADTDITRSSAAATAFQLGINGMRKRPVRTAYTLSTVALISFAMFCFTTPQPQSVQREVVQGAAPFNGILLRSKGDIHAAQARFGEHAKVVARRAERSTTGHEITALAIYRPHEGPAREAPLGGLVFVQAEEAAITNVDRLLLPGGRWFASNDEPVCYLSDVTASELGIRSADLSTSEVHVYIRGQRRRVLGIFDSARLDAQRDIDGESFLPELRSLLSASDIQQQRTQQMSNRPGANAGTVRYLPAAQVAILPLDDQAGGEYHSAVVLFDELPYGEMRDLIEAHMDTTPTFFSFALSNQAFFGGKMRSVGLEAVVDLVIPLLVACCIVFNTLLGSVYQRQSEISVYSALGLSPRHVFYLFLAEAIVYAVLGAVGGYLIGLILQWISHQGGGFLGLTIDYSSRSAVYVWFMIILAVLSSSFVPAWRAARIASPSKKTAWALPPQVQPGRHAFELPFTFRGREAVAVVPFLCQWFDAHGEDSSGAFMSSLPSIDVGWDAGAATMTVCATVRLRPYDLGVSQIVRACVRPSQEKEIFIVMVEMDLQSGSVAGWERTNRRFVALLRRHLLTWRALTARTRLALFDQGQKTLLATS